jgi:hypothetical protein
MEVVTGAPTTKQAVLLKKIANTEFQRDIQHILIKHNDILLFEGYHGVEFGIISNKIDLPDTFIAKYVNRDFCTISDEW